MATESAEEPDVTVKLPASLVDWLDERAASEDVDRDELLVQLLSAYRTTATADSDIEGDGLDIAFSEAIESDLESRFRELESQLDAHEDLTERISSLETQLEEDVEDVRSRILQLRDAVRDRAPADHDHDAFADIETIASHLESVEGDIERLDATVGGLDDRTTNVETTLEEASEKLDRLARVVVSIRQQVDDDTSERDLALGRIKRTAAVEGIAVARCDNCEESVPISLLTEPVCPHCGFTLTDVEPGTSFFGKPTLLGTDAPALEEGNE